MEKKADSKRALLTRIKQNANNKRALMALLALIAAAAVCVCIVVFTRPGTSEGAKTIVVEVVHSDGSEKSFTYHTDEEYLGAVLLSEGLIAGEEGAYGLYIITVDGEDAIYEESGAYWALYEGDDYAMQGVGATPVNDGGQYGLVYTVG